MKEEIPKISVLIITYNQEKVIKRTIESLLSQRECIYEICVSDDCSQDGTWGILQQYSNRYPGLFVLNRNEPNKGIFENIEKTWEMPTGDIIYRVAGDDEAGEDYLKAVLNFIKGKQIDWRNELFCIYGNYKEIEPNGKTMIYRNNLIEHHDPLKLKIRKLLSNRSACYSKKVLDKFEKVSEGRSYSVESVQDGQLALFAEKNYYIPYVGNKYYAGIGVSTRMNKSERGDNTNIGSKKYIDFAKQHGKKIDQKDLAFIEFIKAYRSRNFVKAMLYYFKSIDLSLGIAGLGLNRIFFVLQKKLKIT